MIIKFGGSILTRKNSDKPILKVSLIKRLGKELSIARQNNTNLKIILLHGAGSFGHPLVHKHKLKDKVLSSRSIRGMALTVASMNKMNYRLSEIFQKEGLPTVPIQTSSIIQAINSKINLTNMEFIESILNNNGIPMLGGDLVIDNQNHCRVISADKLVTLFAQHIPSSKIIIASDVDGVYNTFPPQQKDKIMPVLRRSDIFNLQSNKSVPINDKDVTGAMIGKLQELLVLNNRETVIFNGNNSNNLKLILKGQKLGTLVKT